MTAQGWQPGDILGAKDAPHAEFHTAANASHIRVIVKDDNLGLGAKRGSGLAQGECTGLDVFQRLLGRLNADDEDEYEKEQKSREDLKRAIYTERRWGSIRFVKGGFLIGDKIQELIDQEEDRVRQLAQDSTDSEEEPVVEDDSNEASPSEPVEALIKKDKKDKKKKKEKKRKQQEDLEEAAVSTSKSDRKSKKKRKESEDTAEEASTATSGVEDEGRKSKKKKRKGTTEPDDQDEGSATPITKLTPSASVPGSGSSTPLSILGGRHAVRARNIAQKRMAVLDTASLNQVSHPRTSQFQ